MPTNTYNTIGQNIHYIISNITQNHTPINTPLTLSQQEKQELKTITNTKRKQEFIHTRLTLQTLINKLKHKYYGTQKSKEGKPHLKNHKYQISLSHSYPFVAAATTLNHHNIGIDIQTIHTKIQKLKHKFLNNSTQITNNPQTLTLYWSAKEAIYKAKKEKNIHMKDINIHTINNTHPQQGTLTATTTTNTYHITYQIKQQVIHTLAYPKTPNS